MKFNQAEIKRVFIVKLEDNDALPDIIEKFAFEHKINSGLCIMVGGIKKGKIIAGPENPDASPITTMPQEIEGVSEILGVGTIFPDENNIPKLHMHAAAGRKKNTLVGCIREGISVWKIVEFIIIELSGSKAVRKKDRDAGFFVLEP